MLDEASRKALAESLVVQGMARDRARLCVDVAAQAAEDGLNAMTAKCRLAGDVAAHMTTLQIAVQLIRTQAEGLHETILRISRELGTVEGGAHVEVRSGGIQI